MQRSPACGPSYLLCQSLPHVCHALLDLVDGCSGAAIFIFDKSSDRKFLFFQENQNLFDRSIAFTPGRVRTLVYLSILHVQVSDVVVMLADASNGIEVRRSEVPNVEVNLEVLRHRKCLRKTFGGRELIGVLNVGVTVHRDVDLMFLCERDKTLCNT